MIILQERAGARSVCRQHDKKAKSRKATRKSGIIVLVFPKDLHHASRQPKVEKNGRSRKDIGDGGVVNSKQIVARPTTALVSDEVVEAKRTDGSRAICLKHERMTRRRYVSGWRWR
jgi:hypothetical protein